MQPNPQFPVDLVTYTAEILNGKLHFLCSETVMSFVLVHISHYQNQCY